MVVGALVRETTIRFFWCILLTLVAAAYLAVDITSYTGQAALSMEGAGARHLVKPDKLSPIDKDAQASFGDWKFQAVNFLSALDPDFERELLEAEGQQAVPSTLRPHGYQVSSL